MRLAAIEEKFREALAQRHGGVTI